MANFTLKKPNCIDMIFANAINSPITLLPNWNPGANWIVDLYFREINFRNRIIHIIQLFSLENNRPVSEDKESDFSWVWRTLTPKKILCLLLFSFEISSVSPQFLSDVRGLLKLKHIINRKVNSNIFSSLEINIFSSKLWLCIFHKNSVKSTFSPFLMG